MTNQKLPYTPEDLDKILGIEVEIGIGDSDSDDDVFTFKGKMVNYNVSAEDNKTPADFHFHTLHGAIKHFDFSVLKSIRVL